MIDVSGASIDSMTSSAPPQYSADRLWWWTGETWVSATPAQISPTHLAAQPTSRRIDPDGLALVVRLLGGAAAVILLHWLVTGSI
jgi:hypothetical protein